MFFDFGDFDCVASSSIGRAFHLVPSVFFITVTFSFTAQSNDLPSCVIHMKGRPPDVSILI